MKNLNWSKFLGRWCILIVLIAIILGAILIAGCAETEVRTVVKVIPHRTVKGYVVHHTYGVDTIYAEGFTHVTGSNKSGMYVFSVDDSLIAHYRYSLKEGIVVNVSTLKK